MNQEIFALMAHAEDLQKIAEQNQKDLASSINSNKAIVESLPKTAHKAIAGALSLEASKAMENAKTELAKATTAFRRASDEADKATIQIKNAGKTSVILHSLYLLGVAIILALFFTLTFQVLYKNKISRMAELKQEIAIQEETLKKIKSETWGLELHDFPDQKIIFLPKHLKFKGTTKGINEKKGYDALIFE